MPVHFHSNSIKIILKQRTTFYVAPSIDSGTCVTDSKTIALGGGGLLSFVDPWRRIIVCDVLGRKPARYLQLPPPPIRHDKFHDEPLLDRDIHYRKTANFRRPK
jgi:hypothetical protein